MKDYLDLQNDVNDEKLKEVGNYIKSGKVVLFPTETVYGIGTNALDEKAVEKIYDAKERSRKNPINLLVSDISMIEQVAKDISDLEYKLMKAFFPGPFTIILKKNDIVPDIVTAGLDYVGVRIPKGEIAMKLIQYSGVPIAAPSANLSGRPSGTNLDDIFDEFNGKVDFIINGGESDIGMESTIVKVIDGIPHILRPGFISEDQIKEIAGDVIIEENVLEDFKSVSLPSAYLKHYQLNSKCLLVYSDDNEKLVNKINEVSKEYTNPIIICYDENLDKYFCKNLFNMGSKSDLEKVSKNIFKTLRKTEKLNPDIIIIEGVKSEGLGLAIMNRLLNVCNHNFIQI